MLHDSDSPAHALNDTNRKSSRRKDPPRPTTVAKRAFLAATKDTRSARLRTWLSSLKTVTEAIHMLEVTNRKQAGSLNHDVFHFAFEKAETAAEDVAIFYAFETAGERDLGTEAFVRATKRMKTEEELVALCKKLCNLAKGNLLPYKEHMRALYHQSSALK